MFRSKLRTLLILLAVLLLGSGAIALVSPDFGAGFRDGFLDGMNRDVVALKTLIQSPVIKWLFVIAAIYLLAFLPLMWLSARGIIDTKLFARLYMPIWIALGIALLAFDWLRKKRQPRE